jgi:hypothetical protein
VNLAAICSANPDDPACVQVKSRRKRQSCSNGYDINLVSGLTQVKGINITLSNRSFSY